MRPDILLLGVAGGGTQCRARLCSLDGVTLRGGWRRHRHRNGHHRMVSRVGGPAPTMVDWGFARHAQAFGVPRGRRTGRSSTLGTLRREPRGGLAGTPE